MQGIKASWVVLYGVAVLGFSMIYLALLQRLQSLSLLDAFHPEPEPAPPGEVWQVLAEARRITEQAVEEEG